MDAPRRERISRYVELALGCVHREYPNRIGHGLSSDDDVAPPRQLTPAFYGCYDWHSAVHSHWSMVRGIRVCPDADFVGRVERALRANLTADALRVEADYLRGREGFERPYGLGWLLQLASELSHVAGVTDLGRHLGPLESLCCEHLCRWLQKLSHPIRTGEHGQSAFGMSLLWDWAEARGRQDVRELVARCARKFYGEDRAAPLNYEPSGHDFLSPALAEADLMARVLPRDDFAAWLTGFLPEVPEDGSTDWLPRFESADPSDGKLAHLDGLLLSRGWMLRTIARALGEGEPRVSSLLETAREHATHGLAQVGAEHYEGAHWLGSFAMYLETADLLPH